jgi:hypothetical protein
MRDVTVTEQSWNDDVTLDATEQSWEDDTADSTDATADAPYSFSYARI